MRHAGYELSVSGDGRGEGLFATPRFKPGKTVMVGEIARRLLGNHSHATPVGVGQYVLLGGFGSKVNHSCDPNCGVHVNASGAPDLVARRNIEPGQEITFDYAMRNYSIEHFPSPCLCGAAAYLPRKGGPPTRGSLRPTYSISNRRWALLTLLSTGVGDKPPFLQPLTGTTRYKPA